MRTETYNRNLCNKTHENTTETILNMTNLFSVLTHLIAYRKQTVQLLPRKQTTQNGQIN